MSGGIMVSLHIQSEEPVPLTAPAPLKSTDCSNILKGEKDKPGSPDYIPAVHRPQCNVPGITRVVAIVPHDEDGALRHCHSSDMH